MNALFALALAISAAPELVHQWNFDTEADVAAWQPNAFLGDVALVDGSLHAQATGWDPFFVCDGIDIPTSPWQVVVIRMQADKAGQGNLFWTGDTSGPQGGLSENRQTPYAYPGDGAWHDIVIYPFWQSAGSIRKLRLDVYKDATFAIDSIRILDWSGDQEAAMTNTWDGAAIAQWYRVGEGREFWAPPAALESANLGWASIALEADEEGVGALLWGSADLSGLHEQEFAVQPGSRTYNLEMSGVPGWENIVALGLRLPGGKVSVTSLTLGDLPTGPAAIQMTYFGAENGVNRAGQPVRVTAQFTNQGGEVVSAMTGMLTAPEGLRVTPETTIATNLDFESRGVLTWVIESDVPGDYPLSLRLTGAEKELLTDCVVTITAPKNFAVSDYVPAPQPVKTTVDIAAYYFPGWDNPAKWDPIQRVAPIRKPVLGWYDEANPEIVDWQIKWAVENGISVFLVDWYWVKGNEQLLHWLEAYKKSRYRDQLKIAIMWANHNPPGTHSTEDWKAVSERWIADYFTMDSYYQMDGKPAVFLWDHRNIRNDLGGSEKVATAFDASQAAAQAAGFAGIHYVGLHPWGDEATMAQEGYAGVTRYHEWGNAQALAKDPQRMQFTDVVDTVMASWDSQRESQGAMTYYPVVDTGWDSRPWHGNRAKAILGRNPALFTQLLREAKTFVEKTEVPLVILGPMNEWGEGSYIEPNTEFGFDMMNAVRNVFGVGDPATWPQNIAPVDVGLGPYDFPTPTVQHHWTYDTGAEGWSAMMGLGEMSVSDGMLQVTSTSHDPAFVLALGPTRAKDFTGFRVRMQVTGVLPEKMSAQLFWSRGRVGTTEAASVRFPLKTDGAMHDYVIDLSGNPRWRSEISLFRFDPCDVEGVTVSLDEFELLAVGQKSE